ncbi:DUF2163 domain-containing protein [Sphingorhabdus arenilitoris]|uniref:DUF2163 domain-containing protein n=1 Tax=Sphingorhabdus arenilitoris TaxID=1490041 RepID=A0ABV8RDS7_9SPHN
MDVWLAGDLTSAAYAWRLERRDGVTIGFTSHDRDVEIDGLLYRASPGMEPSTISESLGLENNGLEITGMVSGDAISEEDLSAGRWNGCALSVFLFDWTQPAAGKRILAQGELGQVSYSDESFQVELDSAAARLSAPAVPYTSPGCRASFCGGDCGLNQARFRHMRTVSHVDGEQIIFQDQLPGNPNDFAYGYLRWLDGGNSGDISDIYISDEDSVALAAVPEFEVRPGARVILVEGCDKSIATCATRFSNAVNFRGEPHLPGNDLLTRYPGAS